MNTITLVVAVLTLWLVMGLGFLAKYVACKRSGKTLFEAWKTNEGLLFAASVIIPVVVALYRVTVG